MPAPDVLIAGAGPTGLVLALSLAAQGIRFRLIDQKSGPGEHSRAMVVHARTLELYRQFGFGDDVVKQGVKASAAHIRVKGRHLMNVNFAEMGGHISPYPFALAYPQDDHERFLIRKLQDAGGQVDWDTKLALLEQRNEHAVATLLRNNTTEEVEAAYVCGCDGAHSQVRTCLGLGFSGGTYEQVFFVADVKIGSGFQRDMVINLDKRVLTLLFPVRSTGMQRLIGLVPPELSDREDLEFEDVQRPIESQLDIRVTELNWFSRYRVHHRIAERFREGRCFLLGDAGHIHSPAGGQGMNTGIGDAVNLGWKLAHVLQQRASAGLLDTYEPERISFARQLISSTDRAFTAMVGEDLRGEFTRQLLAPLVFFAGTRFLPHVLFRRVSQVQVQYPGSPLSEGKVGKIAGGDRLPWTGLEVDNYAPLRSLDWQVHVYGTPPNALRETCDLLRLPLHTFAWGSVARKAGFARDAIYFVRPDGYVALAADRGQAVERIKAFVGQHGIRANSPRR
jgi:2-polyprenyl-6-methoxyphenol hydroxylase-like FAD-dependent oxidoreductase